MSQDKRAITLNDLEAMLDRFSAKHHGIVQVKHDIVDITDCFFKENNLEVPRSFRYDGSSDFRIVATVAIGYPFVQKYVTDEHGHVKWTYASGKNVPELLLFGDDFRVIACLCGGPLQNTTTGELESVINHGDKVQGFRRQQLKNLLDRLQGAYGFSFVNSSAFMFAGRNREPHATLHNYWLEQIIENGSRALDMMGNREAALIAIAFNYWPKEPVTPEMVMHFGYRRPGDPRLRTEESVWFVYRKFRTFQNFVEATR